MAERWYEMMPHPSQEAMNQYREWLIEIPWQVFATYTFSWRVSDLQADKAFRAYINELEKALRSQIAFVRGDEKRSAAFGLAESGRHYHAVLACKVNLDPVMLKQMWQRYGGAGYGGDSAEVRLCVSQGIAIDYCLKLIDDTEGDWKIRNLDLFIADWSPVKKNKRSRRRAARNQDRVSGGKLHGPDPVQ